MDTLSNATHCSCSPSLGSDGPLDNVDTYLSFFLFSSFEDYVIYSQIHCTMIIQCIMQHLENGMSSGRQVNIRLF